MSLYILIAFYLFVAGCEIGFPKECLAIFEKIIVSAERVRLFSILIFFAAFLYYTAEPLRLRFLITILFWIYLLTGVWFAAGPRSFVRLCQKGYANLSRSEKHGVLYTDCGLRTLLALLLFYAK